MLSTKERKALREKAETGIAAAKQAREAENEADFLQQVHEALPVIHEGMLALSALAADTVERDQN